MKSKSIAAARFVALGLFGLVWHSTASAQIYESTDAQGEPEFSDTPTQGAEVVDLPGTNLAEPPAEQPTAPEQTRPAQEQGMPATDGGGEQGENVDGTVYYGGDDVDSPRVQRRVDEDRVDNALPGDPVPRGATPGQGAGVPGEVHHEAGGRR